MQNKAQVIAIDSSSELIAFAHKRTASDLSDHLTYYVADATKKETFDAIDATFDCIVCNMALMDISNIQPLFEGASQLLKSEGSFVITQTHPCFEKSVGPLFHESEEGQGTTTHIHGVKVHRYLTSSSMCVKAIPTLPKEHLFFHRSLSTLFQIAFQAGLVIDGIEEIAFPMLDAPSEHNGWHLLNDVPVIIGIRFKKA